MNGHIETRDRDFGEALRPIGPRPWTWDAASAVYLDANGNPLPPADLRGLMARFLEVQRQRAEQATGQMVSNQITVPEWETEMRAIIKDAYGASYMLGRGGRYQMTTRDWGKLGQSVREQFQYLNRFAASFAAGSVSNAQALMRSDLYPLSARQVQSLGYSYAIGAPELPAHPGDGSSECFGNCGCAWELQQTTLDDNQPGWECWWERGKTDSCETCIRRENEWAPLRLRATG
jgi:hypothetical protein